MSDSNSTPEPLPESPKIVAKTALKPVEPAKRPAGPVVAPAAVARLEKSVAVLEDKVHGLQSWREELSAWLGTDPKRGGKASPAPVTDSLGLTAGKGSINEWVKGGI